MRILALSDVELPAIYNSRIRERFSHVDIVISCGDLSFEYLDFIVSMLDVPLYYVNGNHTNAISMPDGSSRSEPWGAFNLHCKTMHNARHHLLMAGLQGCLRYKNGPNQYTQCQYWFLVLGLVPKLIWNKLRYGRFLDIFVSHAAPWGIQDDTDPAHRGIRAFRWLIKTFRPALHLHGHIHLYMPTQPRETQLPGTRVINAYGYREISFTPDRD
ncbi:MAG: metallophosphoesterase family protein [Anaerolineaceae bacterium]|jgi:hypothetical protein